ncbi:MAG: DNA methyltransferase [Myxococcota bacterium]
MSLDSSARNALARMVGDARTLLVTDLSRELESTWGFGPDGTPREMDRLPDLDEGGRAVAQVLRAWHAHLFASQRGSDAARRKAAMERMVREAAFTSLNRLVALRLCEARGVVAEAIRGGPQAEAFAVFEQVAEGGLGDRGTAWRAYLDRLYDELAAELPLLFDRRASASRLAPSTRCLEDVVTVLDRPELDLLWESDETIGWVYQYFHTDKERTAMRKASPTPKDGRELAVRNQFFTPRYVVEFLTDNTLGRMWWEMQRGDTRLVDDCRYLYREPGAVLLRAEAVSGRRPAWIDALRRGDASGVPEHVSRDEGALLAHCINGYEVLQRRGVDWGAFLEAQRAAYATTGTWPGDALDLWTTAFVTERAIRHGGYEPEGDALRELTALYDQLCAAIRAGGSPLVPPRVKVDPRELRVLDPACGSGHFLLYAFDLMETIWVEAWDGSDEIATALKADFPDRDAFVREVPALILRHNLWGVDIDSRAAQIAAMALWLRAQKSWRNIPPGKRPTVRKTNIVVAEPMPGERDLFDEFAGSLRIPGLRRLMTAMWEKLRAAGEMGVLLRVEDELRAAIEEARQLSMDDVGTADETPEGFWKKAEVKVLDALRDWAESAGRGWDQRRMFADDAARGFAFVDLCRQKFDVVLMNPPFGTPTEGTLGGLSERYPASGGELYSMFYQRALEMTQARGRVGAITARTWLGLQALGGLRREVFGRLGRISIASDLGFGVLDAMVETAAAVVARDWPADAVATWYRVVQCPAWRKASFLLGLVNATSSPTEVFRAPAKRFASFPDAAYGYWISPGLSSLFTNVRSFSSRAGDAMLGVWSGDDTRFLRAAWEVPPHALGLACDWARFAKGGEYRPFFDDPHLAIRWARDRAEMTAVDTSRTRDASVFGQAGVTWPLRTNYRLAPRVLPAGCAFGHKGPSAFPFRSIDPSLLLAVLNSRASFSLMSVRLANAVDSNHSTSKAYEISLVRDLPWPDLSQDASARITTLTQRCVGVVRHGQVEEDDTGETVVAYAYPPSLPAARDAGSLRGAAFARVAAREDRLAFIASATAEIDHRVANAYGFTERDRQVLDKELEPPLAALSDDALVDPVLFRDAYLTKKPIPGDTLPGGLEAEVDVRVEHRRGKQHAGLRDETMLCRLFGVTPRHLATVRHGLGLLRPDDVRNTAMDLVHYAVGVAFGRWDLRLALDPALVPEWPDAFGALPRCPVGQLVDSEGLPATQERVVTLDWLADRRDASSLPEVDGQCHLPDGAAAEAPAATVYDVPVAWSGLLADDDGVPFDPDDPIARPPTYDLATRVTDVFVRLFGNRGHDVLHECCEALGVKDLREYLRTPAKFFADHLSRYSKSRRKAPIYWPLSVASGTFTAWVYYPRLSDQTLHALINDELLPRLGRVEEERARIETRLESATGRNAERLVEARDKARAHAQELRELRASLDAVNALPFRPDLDDGVVINASPLRAHFRLKPWRDELEGVWKSLTSGEYDWAHLAMTLRRDEVLAKCGTDKSIAIAHGREDLYVAPAAPARGRKKKAEPGLFDVRNDE